LLKFDIIEIEGEPLALRTLYIIVKGEGFAGKDRQDLKRVNLDI